MGSSSGIGAGVLTCCWREGKYEPSASAESKADSSRERLREGLVLIGVMLSIGVQVVEW